MQREVLTHPYDIKVASSAIEGFTAGRAFADYERDVLLRSAVERQFGIIGAALTRAQQRDPGLAAGSWDYPMIVDFANILAHADPEIRDRAIWGVVKNDLPTLRREVEALLAQG